MVAVSPSPDVERFDALVREGRELADRARFTEAVRALTEANRLHRTPELERTLVQLRLRGFSRVDAPAGPAAWPRPLDDPFPGLDGVLPEIRPDQLAGEVVGGGILHHGAVVVRGLLTPEQVATVVADIDRAFDAYDRWADGTVTDDDWFVPFDGDLDGDTRQRRAWVRQNEALWAADSPPAMFELLELLDGVGVSSLVHEHFGEPPALSANKFTMRRVPPAGFATWHQDGAFLGEGVRALNLWITLSRCGGTLGDTPALAVVPRRIDELLDSDSAWVANAVNVDLVSAKFGDEITLPEFGPGDALLFDERFLHLTSREPGMTKPRYTIETWYFPPSTFPPDYTGLAI